MSSLFRIFLAPIAPTARLMVDHAIAHGFPGEVVDAPERANVFVGVQPSDAPKGARMFLNAGWQPGEWPTSPLGQLALFLGSCGYPPFGAKLVGGYPVANTGNSPAWEHFPAAPTVQWEDNDGITHGGGTAPAMWWAYVGGRRGFELPDACELVQAGKAGQL